MDYTTNLGGLVASAHRAWDTTLSMLKNRVELATIEFKEEKTRLTSVAIWGGLFIFSSFMAVIAIACTLLFMFWEQKLWVAAGLLGFFVIALLTAFLLLRGHLKSPAPFAETFTQLKKDRAWLQGRN